MIFIVQLKDVAVRIAEGQNGYPIWAKYFGHWSIGKSGRRPCCGDIEIEEGLGNGVPLKSCADRRIGALKKRWLQGNRYYRRRSDHGVKRPGTRVMIHR